MEQVEIFLNNSMSQLQKDINDWIKEERLKITRVLQSQSDTEEEFIVTISIFYETEADNAKG